MTLLAISIKRAYKNAVLNVSIGATDFAHLCEAGCSFFMPLKGIPRCRSPPDFQILEI